MSKPISTGTLPINSNRCKCTVCGEVFSTERNFEKHRTGLFSEGRSCTDPEDVGLVLMDTANGTVWKMPAPVTQEVWSYKR